MSEPLFWLGVALGGAAAGALTVLLIVALLFAASPCAVEGRC